LDSGGAGVGTGDGGFLGSGKSRIWSAAGIASGGSGTSNKLAGKTSFTVTESIVSVVVRSFPSVVSKTVIALGKRMPPATVSPV